MAFKAMFIPADFNQKVALVEVHSYDQLEELLGGIAERAAYDRDAEVYVNGVGVTLGLAHNIGASDYVSRCSDAARQHGGWIDVHLHGNVIMTGPDLTDVPERLIEEFGVTERQNVDELLIKEPRMDYGEGFGPGL